MSINVSKMAENMGMTRQAAYAQLNKPVQDMKIMTILKYIQAAKIDRLVLGRFRVLFLIEYKGTLFDVLKLLDAHKSVSDGDMVIEQSEV